MAYEDVVDLDCDVVVSLGGKDKKTGKTNPTRLEGYYIGTIKRDSKKYRDDKGKPRVDVLHVFKTEQGNVGTYGRGNLNGKLSNAPFGTMTEVTFSGMKPTDMNDMYVYKVRIDKSNTIDVSSATHNQVGGESEQEPSNYSSEDTDEDQSAFDESEQEDTVVPSRPHRPSTPATISAAKTTSVQDLIARRSNKSA